MVANLTDPTRLPETVEAALREIGPSLVEGLTYREIAARLGRSEDYVAERVRLIRRALEESVARRDD